jgi:TolB-like protein
LVDSGGDNETSSDGKDVIFLSYASEDVAAASAIVDALRATGLTLWFDRSELRGGDTWDQSIRERIRKCRLFIPIVSAHTEARSEGYFRREWKLAADRTEDMASDLAFIVPVVIDGTASATARVPQRFREVQWIRLPGAVVSASFLEHIRGLMTRTRAVEAGTARSGASLAEPASPPPMVQRARRVSRAGTLFVAALLLIAGAGYFATRQMGILRDRNAEPQQTTTNTYGEKSIAVLPFVDMSEKRDQEYFADGMAEEVLDLLAGVPSIKVIARTSSFQFKNRSVDLRSVGDALGAAYVVEGSVRKSADQLRVTAQLVRANDGSHVWSETYDESSGDALTIQGRIAASIVRALQVTIGADDLPARPQLKNPESYDLYLRGRHAMDRFDKAGFESAAGYFQQALERDPSFVRAAEWLAVAHEFLAEWGFVPVREGYERARASVERALKLDPQSGLAHSMLCTIEAVYDWNSPEALKECRRALVLEPRNPQVLLYAGQMEDIVGHWDEAEHLLSTGVGLDPLFAGFHVLLGIADEQTGRLAEAEQRRRLALTISPSYVRAHYALGTTLLAEGKPAAALEEMLKESADGGRDAGLAMAYHALGRKAESNAALARLVKERAGDMASWIAEVHAFRGENDQAFAWLDRAYVQRDVNLWWFKTVLAFNRLKSDPRYKPFITKMNLAE